MVAIKSPDINGQAAVHENEFPILRIVDTSQGINLQVLLNITSELIDI
jgi:hypothetical protein